MTRRTVAPERDAASAEQETRDDVRTVRFGYRGERFEVQLDDEQERALEAVLERYIALGRVTD